MIIKVYNNLNNECKNIVATSFKTLLEKSQEKYGFEISKFLLKNDHSEIDDEEIFIEMSNLSNNMEIIAVQKGTECKIDKKLNEAQARLEKLWTSSVMSTFTKQKEQNSLLENQIKILENSIPTLENEKIKEKNLLDRLKSLTQKTITTQEYSKSAIRTLEDRVTKAEAYRYKISNLFYELKQAEKVDVCFMVDSTGSMKPYISEAKTVINKIVTKLSRKFQDFSIRFSVVGYRDIYNGNDRVTVFPFSENEVLFRSFVSSIQPISNDDICEDVFGGLEEVTKLDWKNSSRVLFHIGDSPCHGSRFHNGCNDKYPQGDPRGLSITSLLKKIVDLKINYYFAEINNSTDKMIGEFNYELNKLGGNLIKITKLNAIEDLADTVIKSVESTIMMSKSLSMSFSKGKNIKPFELIELNWKNLVKEKVEFYFVNCHSITDIKKFEFEYEKKIMDVHLAVDPFAKGSLRLAYAGLIDNDAGHFKKNSKLVLKQSMFSDEKYNTIDHMKESIENQLVSCYLAQVFDKVNTSNKRIRFLNIAFIRRLRDGQFFSCEEYIDSNFIKYQNNAGYVNTEEYSTTLHAFIHWTHQFTNGYLIVTDLQGSKNNNEFVLTDPAINCPKDFDRFSSTNLGIKGMNSFFKTHECNLICQSLKLERHPKQLSKEIKNNFFSTQLK